MGKEKDVQIGDMILKIEVGSLGKCAIGFNQKEITSNADLIDAMSDAMYGFLKFYASLSEKSPLRADSKEADDITGASILGDALDAALSKYNDFEDSVI